jgi:hypothetical protein
MELENSVAEKRIGLMGASSVLGCWLAGKEEGIMLRPCCDWRGS